MDGAERDPAEEVIVDDIQTVDEDEETLPFQYSITAYGADYPVDGLVKRLQSGSIYTPPFQRGFVWTPRQGSRFIESLLLGLPVPGIFLSREEDGGSRLLIIDGQQRLLTLQYFYQGVYGGTGREFKLLGVQDRYSGLTYRNLEDSDRIRLDDSIVHATIVRQDVPTNDSSSIYHVFERLNTGGTPLSPQEIRACVYHGKLNTLLRELNNLKEWRSIFGPPNNRMRDQELILRFLAFRFARKSYQEPLKGFLNAFMGAHSDLSDDLAERFAKAFKDAVGFAYEALGPQAFKPVRALNASVFESVMVGISERIESDPSLDTSRILDAYGSLLGDPSFRNATERATASREAVATRFSLAHEAFADV
ncbi:DUF262 domain-containing protein [Actinopolymorpha sp. NPDC004070]|uniref:DUF262 domain-containing protein n=1 Tax=Actinopolymorpha sp. NPDC004070 TaxID=3154548 RepID=UPI0033A0C49A